METGFTVKEKRQWMLKKHIKDHALEYIFEILGTMIYTFILLKVCKAEYVLWGVVLSFAWSLGRVISQIRYYKKEYIDMDIK